MKPGNPGIKLKPEYDKIMKTFTVPKNVYEDIKNQMVIFINKRNCIKNILISN